jgi:hypothetical protein
VPTIEVRAVSRGMPVDDLVAHSEGGLPAAAEALARLMPGTPYEHVVTSTWAEPHHRSFDDVLVSTFGDTAILLASPVPRLSVPESMTTFSLSYQTVSMAYGVDVSGPQLERIIALSPGVLDYAQGPPLPFESAFPRATEESATYSFDQDAFAAAAAEWMFGCHPLELDGDHRVDLGSQPLHTFTAVPSPVPTDQQTGRSRRGGLRGLFRRR